MTSGAWARTEPGAFAPADRARTFGSLERSGGLAGMGETAVLGLSSDSCTPAAALVVDGAVVTVASAESSAGSNRHESPLQRAAGSCLSIAGLDASQVDVVAHPGKPLADAARLLATWQRQGPRGVLGFADGLAGRYGDDLLVAYRTDRLMRALGARRPPPAVFGEHLLSLAAAAFLPSPFESAAILVVADGGWGTAAIGTGSHHRVDLLEEQFQPNSLVSLWSLVATWCGLDAGDVRRVSALATDGDPAYVEALADIAAVDDDGAIRVDGRVVRWWDQHPPGRLGRLFGPGRRPGEPLEQRHADLARSLQEVTASAIVAMARHARRVTGARRLCLGGPLGSDGVVTTRVREEAGFDDVWACLLPDGEAAALGAALWHWHGDLGNPREGREPVDLATSTVSLADRRPAEDVEVDPGTDEEASRPVVHHRRSGPAATLVRAVGAVVGLFTVLLPWVVHRLLRLDPLERRGGQGWSQLGRPEVEPSRQGSSGTRRNHLSRTKRLRWAMATPLCVLLVVTPIALAWFLTRTPPHNDPPAAIGHVDWWSDYLDELDWAFNRPGGATNPYEFPPLHDVRGRFVNVVDGDRVSWKPPACDCRRLRVWVYGGSTVLGWGQRDDHTIPSELARTAWERDGIALDVENKGIPGHLGWQSAQRFAWDLATRPAPDLVIFYEGYNDLRAAIRTNDEDPGAVSEDWPTTWNRKNLIAETAERNRIVQRFFGRPPEGASRRPTTTAPGLDPTRLGSLVAEKYLRGRRAAADTAAAAEVPVAWFWQPHQVTRPLHRDEPPPNEAVARSLREADRSARQDLPPEVHDLSGVFDRVDAPIYWDDVHTGERGARIIAENIYSVVAPQLRAAASGG